jgi:hypothetical protein
MEEEAAIIPACFQSGPDQGVVLRSAPIFEESPFEELTGIVTEELTTR